MDARLVRLRHADAHDVGGPDVVAAGAHAQQGRRVVHTSEPAVPDGGAGGSRAGHPFRTGAGGRGTATADSRDRGSRDATGGGPRLEQLRSSALQLGMALPHELVVRGEHTREAGATGFAELMSRRHRPDAVFCGNDVIAAGAREKAHELGFDIPRDVTLVGHDDAPFATLVRPRLTTIRYPAAEAARAATRLLTERPDGREGHKTVQAEAEFVARSSA
ncbi:substrate-binding domain-containing protein [Streptomyces roseolus]|uniref:substrate-binding domain-containing protein n=1 Tax=Streptomyces roseolus TaxID=67358 RepID=UPI003648BC20